MLADASSSANVNLTIIAAEYASPDIVTVRLSGDVSIVSRLCYFDEPLTIDVLPLTLSEIQSENLYQAGRRFLAEKQALVYLNRAEHSSYQLTIKLQKKGYVLSEYQPVLDFLHEGALLDDSRFASAWLHTRTLSKKEGYAKLFAELRKRGIDSNTAKRALADFLSDVDETVLCEEAIRKLIRKGYDGQKLFRALQRKGFSFSMIKRCLAHVVSAVS